MSPSIKPGLRSRWLAPTRRFEIANELVDACADVLRISTRAGTGRGKISSFVMGLKWTDDESQELNDAVERIMGHRRALIRLAREESGSPIAPEAPEESPAGH